MKIKLFTMVKNEEDIIEYWINYHGSIFGYRNLHIIDNNSDDGTYEKIMKYKKIGVNIYREPDYKLKGKLLTGLIKEQQKIDAYDLAIPIDIDEFVVHYDKRHKTLNPSHIRIYINELMKTSNDEIFKMNYIQSTINSQNDYGYNNALLESLYGKYEDYGNVAKTFFNINKWTGELDHGNHYCCENYVLTDMVLVHYHCRNLDQMKKKITTNINGLGYPTDKVKLENILVENKNPDGTHHIKHMIDMLDNKFEINTRINGEGQKDYICLKPLISFFLKLSIQ